jgi:thioesterase domain-containing protein
MISRGGALGNKRLDGNRWCMTKETLHALTEIWASRMPITAALGVVPVLGDPALLAVRLPLLPNRNHKGTIFAGSLSAAATLAGWSALWLMARDAGLNPHIVLQDASIKYLAPARSDVRVVCPMPEPKTRARVLEVFHRRGRVRTRLEVTIYDESGAEVVSFEGRYVVHRLDWST